MGIEHLPASAWDRNPMPIGSDLLRQIVRLDRDRLERLITVAIEYLDNVDGDSDSEVEPDDEPETDCCEAGDDGCGPLLRHGSLVWGSEYDEHYRVPSYGIDQTADLGPEWLSQPTN